ncbi:MAG: hypothetical protein ABI644_12720 [Arenimonas sp.]
MNFKSRFVFPLLFCAFAIVTGTASFAAPAPSKTSTHTPAKGSEERKAIMEVLRVMVRKMSGLQVIFVVGHLKVNNDWAWVEAEPASADGSQHYETVTGLLHRENGHWVYVEGPPEFAICEEDPDCADTVRYFKKLSKKYPELSAEIFPK